LIHLGFDEFIGFLTLFLNAFSGPAGLLKQKKGEKMLSLSVLSVSKWGWICLSPFASLPLRAFALIPGAASTLKCLPQCEVGSLPHGGEERR
jgi:hypothetical protein